MSKSNAEKIYSDIINLPHWEPTTQPRMPRENRAAAFSPFAALTGHGDLINETARLTEQKIELDDYAKEQINRRLRLALEQKDAPPELTVVYFCPDERKDGGAVNLYTGRIKKLDEETNTLVFEGGDRIPIENIYDVALTEELLTD